MAPRGLERVIPFPAAGPYTHPARVGEDTLAILSVAAANCRRLSTGLLSVTVEPGNTSDAWSSGLPGQRVSFIQHG
jgi:hypothetical protein